MKIEELVEMYEMSYLSDDGKDFLIEQLLNHKNLKDEVKI